MNEKAENSTAKFDWVTARSSCSLPKVFQELRLQAEGDVKTRNGLRPNNSPYEFSVKDNVNEFTVLLEAKVEAQTLDNYKGSEGALLFRFVVEEGKQTRVASLSIEGNRAVPRI